jgi:hypothetical protein
VDDTDEDENEEDPRIKKAQDNNTAAIELKDF